MIFSKKNTRFSVMGMLAAVFTAGCLLTGCGDSADAKSDAAQADLKYLLYKKSSDEKSIIITGLNVECDESGTLKVDLGEIASKNNGKLVIPATIDGLPVKKVILSSDGQNKELGGDVIRQDNVSLRVVTTNDEMKYYCNNSQKYYDMITDVVIPDGVEFLVINCKLTNLTVPASVQVLGCSRIPGKLVVPDQAYLNFSSFIMSAEEETEVFATNNTPVTSPVDIPASKVAKLPDTFKKISVDGLFSSLNGYRIPDRLKGAKLYCAPDAQFYAKYNLDEINKNLKYDDFYVNDRDFKYSSIKDLKSNY